jgi:hypothetical protein
MKDLAPIEINLNVSQEVLTESWLGSFGELTKVLLKYTFGTSFLKEAEAPVKIKGTPRQVETFTNALNKEGKYMQAYLEHGLSDPKTHEKRHSLYRAVERFEKETGIKWPFQN